MNDEAKEKTVIIETSPRGPVLAYRLLYYLVDLIEVVLILRFVFKLLAANPGNAFVAFLYNLTDKLIFPFRGIFPVAAIDGAVLEWATLVAMIVYALLGWGIIRLLKIAFER